MTQKRREEGVDPWPSETNTFRDLSMVENQNILTRDIEFGFNLKVSSNIFEYI